MVYYRCRKVCLRKRLYPLNFKNASDEKVRAGVTPRLLNVCVETEVSAMIKRLMRRTKLPDNGNPMK